MSDTKPQLIGPKVDPLAYEIGTVITTDGRNYYLDPDTQLAGGHFILVEGHEGPTWDSFHTGTAHRVYRYLRAEDIEPDFPVHICPSCGASLIPPHDG